MHVMCLVPAVHSNTVTDAMVYLYILSPLLHFTYHLHSERIVCTESLRPWRLTELSAMRRIQSVLSSRMSLECARERASLCVCVFVWVGELFYSQSMRNTLFPVDRQLFASEIAGYFCFHSSRDLFGYIVAINGFDSIWQNKTIIESNIKRLENGVANKAVATTTNRIKE